VSSFDRRRRREAAARKRAFLRDGPRAPVQEQDCASTELHDERLDAVVDVLRERGAASVLDLGCGAGALLKRLAAETQFTRIVGLDVSLQALRQAERALAAAGHAGDGRIALTHGSFTSADTCLAGFDAAAMVETLEHIPPRSLSQVERTVFAELRPGLVLITTPNREYNVLFGLSGGERRHPDHCFEWSRQKFQSWAAGVAHRTGYHVEFEGLGPADPLHGSPTQLGVFTRQSINRQLR
jgi:small RNA 2'-O-methyltransferase